MIGAAPMASGWGIGLHLAASQECLEIAKSNAPARPNESFTNIGSFQLTSANPARYRSGVHRFVPVLGRTKSMKPADKSMAAIGRLDISVLPKPAFKAK
jgi:hypothetical protein